MLDDLGYQVVARILGVDVTRNALSQAFDSVANKTNWKLPIDAVVTINDKNGNYERSLILEAVRFFAGCEAQISKCSMAGNKWRVRAVGYYAAVGA